MAYTSEVLFSEKRYTHQDKTNNNNFPEGKTSESLVHTRVNQNFFRKMTLSTYNSTCCITGINTPSLLVASHIVPWAHDEKNRLNPQNGLCLNALHDKAFDQGLLTIDESYSLRLSRKLEKERHFDDFFGRYDHKKIMLPQRFVPSQDFLEYHRETIFIP